MDEDENDARGDDGDARKDRKRGDVAEGEDPYTVFMIMDSLFDKLKLLNYDAEFCAKRGFKPIPRHYFAIQENASEQLHYFGNLMSWLLSLAGQRFIAPDQYDDPNQVATSVMLELRKQGLPTEFSQTKLKQGFGEEICQILNNLAQNALKALKWKWLKPEHGREEFIDETPHDEDVEVVADRVVEQETVDEDIDDDDDEGGAAPKAATADGTTPQDKDTALDEEQQRAWLAEVERVLPQLKVHLRTDVKDWRGHIDEMKTNTDSIGGCLTTAKDQLDKLQTEIAKTLEKIGSREKYVNSQLEALVRDYRGQQDSYAAVNARWTASSGGVNELARQLAQISDELETVKNELDKHGTNMTDSGPLVKIKQALSKLKLEASQMDVRIGVIEHILLSASQREKADIVHNMHAVPLLDDE